MRRNEPRTALYVDFDSFFASAEQQMVPELRGRPVGIIPVDSPHTGLIAASREAKAAGVARGHSVREARARLPGIALVVARHHHYAALHRSILSAVEEVVPVAAVRSVDEVLCWLTGPERADPLRVARAVKAVLARRVGEVLTCSIGLGPTELIAKIAAEREKPDGLVAIRPSDLPGAYAGTRLIDVPGIARRMAARLEAAGVRDVADLLARGPRGARALWGSVEGERIWTALSGLEVERPIARRGLFGHGRVLPRDWRTPARARDAARYLLVKAARRMRAEGFAAGGLALWLTARDGAGWYGEERFAPRCDDQAVLAGLERLFFNSREDAPAHPKAVHVALSRLVLLDQRAADLFPDSTRDRWERLAFIADALHRRHHRCLLSPGSLVAPPGDYAGSKIAFGRVPTAEEEDAEGDAPQRRARTGSGSGPGSSGARGTAKTMGAAGAGRTAARLVEGPRGVGGATLLDSTSPVFSGAGAA